MKKCTNCGTMCADDMNFCTECGHPLGSQSTTITRIVKQSIENKYIDQGLVPTNYMSWKKPRIMRFLFMISILLFVAIFLLYSYFMLIEKANLFNLLFDCPEIFVLFITCGIIAIFIYRPYPQKSTAPLSSIADYVERYMIFGLIYTKRHPKYVIYVKDNKYGILDATTYSIATKAKYDSLVWRKEKGYLDAELDGSKMIIDVHDNCLK